MQRHLHLHKAQYFTGETEKVRGNPMVTLRQKGHIGFNKKAQAVLKVHLYKYAAIASIPDDEHQVAGLRIELYSEKRFAPFPINFYKNSCHISVPDLFRELGIDRSRARKFSPYDIAPGIVIIDLLNEKTPNEKARRGSGK